MGRPTPGFLPSQNIGGLVPFAGMQDSDPITNCWLLLAPIAESSRKERKSPTQDTPYANECKARHVAAAKENIPSPFQPHIPPLLKEKEANGGGWGQVFNFR